MINEILKDSESRMNKTLEALSSELSKIRAGRAHPSVLDQVMVDYYGTQTSLNQVANVNASDARTLTIIPWEKEMVAPIEKAIMESGLGLNPATAGTTIRLPMPALTEERRLSLVKVIKQAGENSKVSIRNIRRDSNADFKELLKDKDISEDGARKAEADMQNLTNKFVAEIDQKIVEKESSLMEI